MGRIHRQKDRNVNKTPLPEKINSPSPEFLGRTILPLLLVLLLSLLVNLNVLQNGVGWDDEFIVTNLQAPETLGKFVRLIQEDLFRVSLSKENIPYYRPMVSISYQLDNMLWGHRPAGFHLSVLIAHLINTTLVFFLARGLVSETTWPSHPASNSLPIRRFLPYLAAALFSVHPAHAEAIAWIAGRNDVFCTAFILSSLLLYIRFRKTDGRTSFALSMFFFICALLTKETAVGMVILFPLYDFLSMAPVTLNADRQDGEKATHRVPVLRAWVSRISTGWLIPMTILGLYFWVRTNRIVHPFGQGSSVGPLASDTIQRTLGAIGLYFKLMVFPYPHRPFIADLPSSSPALVLTVLITGLLLAGFVMALIRRNVLFGIGLAWMSALLAPAVLVSVLNVASTPAAERYVYAPSVGFLIVGFGLITWGFERLQISRPPSSSKAVILTGSLILLILSAWSIESRHRNSVWLNPMTFWQAAMIGAPEAGYPRRELGKHFVESGRLEEAEPVYREAALLDEKRFGSNHPALGEDLNLLGTLYQKEGRYSEAEPVFKQALMIREKTLGPDHPDMAVSLNNLGELYYHRGKFKEAEPLYRRALAIYEKNGGTNNPEMALTLNNLAGLYDAIGKYAEAEPLYRQALAIREKTLGPDHTDVAQTLNNLAVLYHRQGRFVEAESLYKRSLGIREKILGPNHADLAPGLNNLAGLYLAQGKYSEAEPLFQRALAIREKTLRPDHPDLVTSLENYAVLLRKMKRETEAASMEARARMIRGRQDTTVPAPK